MPIHLRAPAYDPRGPDGHGWNRLSVTLPIGDQCALQPRSYPALVESHDTRRARWGGFGPCIRDGDCQHCPVFQAPPVELRASGDRILVRIHPHDQQPYLMNNPAAGWASFAYRWTWPKLARLTGWAVGDRHTDEHSQCFWLIRVKPRA